ncbi:MAG TPA: hypothetical protein VGQ00_03465 [Candidatus Norongarragalinales archaeon]|jgi:hypothetical protein|nr:hypothetical protein [Candidatus Norongarragalinales archaeon]
MKMRGQSALEYLTTYGWAILAIVIIAGVLWFFGVFTPCTKGAVGFTGVAVSEFALRANGDVDYQLQNQAGASIINVTGVGIKGTSCVVTPFALSSGAKSTTLTCTNPLPAGSVGDCSTNINMTISYTDTASSIAHTSGGRLTGKLE